MTTDVIIEVGDWPANLPDLADVAVRATLGAAGLDPDAHDVAILAADDARLAALNARFRGKDASTNVLSFPSADLAPGEPPPAELGDVALAWETCAREADAFGKPVAHHVAHLIVHAVLHLLGHDHEDDGAADLMERLERDILEGLGVPDPYAAPPE